MYWVVKKESVRAPAADADVKLAASNWAATFCCCNCTACCCWVSRTLSERRAAEFCVSMSVGLFCLLPTARLTTQHTHLHIRRTVLSTAHCTTTPHNTCISTSVGLFCLLPTERLTTQHTHLNIRRTVLSTAHCTTTPRDTHVSTSVGLFCLLPTAWLHHATHTSRRPSDCSVYCPLHDYTTQQIHLNITPYVATYNDIYITLQQVVCLQSLCTYW